MCNFHYLLITFVLLVRNLRQFLDHYVKFCIINQENLINQKPENVVILGFWY